jgi:leucyl aminopeptidase
MSATLNVSSTAPSRERADALVIGTFSAARGLSLADGAADVDLAFEKKLVRALRDLGATGDAGEVVTLASFGAVRAPVVVAVGLGARERHVDPEVLRRAAGAAARNRMGTTSIAYALPADDVESAAAVAEGALLGAYAFNRFRAMTASAKREPVRTITICTRLTYDRELGAAIRRIKTIGRAVELTRDLVNTPPSALHPKELAEAAVAAARGTSVEVEVLDEKALTRGGYGGTMAVGMGSVNPPRMVRMTYRPARSSRHLGLVGKGITFDSGGLSLKSPSTMDWMKCDMGGAAAVIAATVAIARLRLPIDVTTYAALAENMPSGSAQRPGDVITIYGGHTVEVLNTDAEGRLVMADALVAVSADEPDLIIDVATLTGAQLVALGARTGAVMSNDDEIRDSIADVAHEVGDGLWPMPLLDELHKSLSSPIADTQNMGERYGGMLVAGSFLEDFVGEGIRWAHLDVAGPAFNQGDPYGYTPKGGTGEPVRTLVEVARRVALGELGGLPDASLF